MPALQFSLLGKFEAWRDDRLIPTAHWRTRQTQTVLKILLHEGDRLVTFDRLVDAVWPEAGVTAARTSLRGAIRTIRHVLEPDLPARSPSRYVHVAPGGYRLEPGACEIDVDRFIRAARAGAAAVARAANDEAEQAYREAAALYRGDYLADDLYADWALDRRERLRTQFLEVLEQLASLLARNGGSREAVDCLERALRLDFLREDLYCELMRVHAAAGHRSHALAAYERCRSVLASELGVQPAAETRQLRDQIAAETAPAAGEPGPDAVPSSLELAFVGRQRELAALRGLWTTARVEAGHLALVRGEAGIGKTRLAQHFATDGRLRAVWLTGHEAEKRLPYGPLVPVLTTWLEASATVAQVSRMGPYAPALAQLIPELRSVWPDCPQPERGTAESSQLLEALARAVLLIAGPTGLLVLDDIQWFDRSTCVWIGYALRRFPAGILTVAAMRSGEVAPAVLETVLEAARKRRRLLEFAIGPLAEADVRRLSSPLTPEPGEEVALARQLLAATGGNPLFLVETLRELRRQGLGYAAGTDEWRPAVEAGTLSGLPLPGSVRDAIGARLARLPGPARSALAAMCVLGTPAGPALIGAMVAATPEEVTDQLETLLRRNLVRQAEDGQAYWVEHPLVRRVVYDQMGDGHRRQWHRRAYAALAAAGPGASAGQLMGHLLACDASTEEVVRVGIEAGDGAVRQFAYEEALEAYRSARDRALDSPAPLPAAQLRLLDERWSEALLRVGRWDEAAAAYERLLAVSDAPLDRSRMRRKVALALSEYGAAGLVRALELLDTAERDLDLPGLDKAAVRLERGRIEGTRTAPHFHRSDYKAVIECGRRALELLEGVPGTENDVREQVLRMSGAEQRLGNLPAAEAGFRRLLAMARVNRDRLAEAGALDALGVVMLHRGDPRRARAQVEEALRIYDAMGRPKSWAITVGNLGFVLDNLGELRGARAAYESAISTAEAIDARYTAMHNEVGLGEVLTRLGDYPLARRTLESAMALAREIGTRQRLAHAHLDLGQLRLEEDAAEDALPLVEEGMRMGAEIGDSHCVRVGNPILARVLLRLGRLEAAAAAARTGLEGARRWGFVLDEGRNLAALGEALHPLGDAYAGAALAEAEAVFRSAGAEHLLALTLYARATTVLARRPREAAGALEEAVSLAGRSGAEPLLRRIADVRRPNPVRT